MPGQGEVTADAACRFALAHLPPGRYRVEVRASGYEGGAEQLHLHPRGGMNGAGGGQDRGVALRFELEPLAEASGTEPPARPARAAKK